MNLKLNKFDVLAILILLVLYVNYLIVRSSLLESLLFGLIGLYIILRAVQLVQWLRTRNKK